MKTEGIPASIARVRVFGQPCSSTLGGHSIAEYPMGLLFPRGEETSLALRERLVAQATLQQRDKLADALFVGNGRHQQLRANYKFPWRLELTSLLQPILASKNLKQIKL